MEAITKRFFGFNTTMRRWWFAFQVANRINRFTSTHPSGNNLGWVKWLVRLSVSANIAGLLIGCALAKSVRLHFFRQYTMFNAHGHLVYPSTTPLSFVQATLRLQPEVAGVSRQRIIQTVLVANGKHQILYLTGIEPQTEIQVSDTLRSFSGDKPLAAFEPGHQYVILGASLAERLKVKPGNDVEALIADKSALGLITPKKMSLKVFGTVQTHSVMDWYYAAIPLKDCPDSRGTELVVFRLHDPYQATEFAHYQWGAQATATWLALYQTVKTPAYLLSVIISASWAALLVLSALAIGMSLLMTLEACRPQFALLRSLGAGMGFVTQILASLGIIELSISSCLGMLMGSAWLVGMPKLANLGLIADPDLADCLQWFQGSFTWQNSLAIGVSIALAGLIPVFWLARAASKASITQQLKSIT